jgi:hypothetical protein
VLNATFNISIIWWRSALLVEETGVPGENSRPVASHWLTLSHNVASCTACLCGFELTTLVVFVSWWYLMDVRFCRNCFVSWWYLMNVRFCRNCFVSWWYLMDVTFCRNCFMVGYTMCTSIRHIICFLEWN